MGDLDRRLRRALRDDLPEPSEEARARAEDVALDALPTPARARHRPWLVAAAATAVLVAAGVVGLATTDRLDVRIGREAPPPAASAPAPALSPGAGRIGLPAGAGGIAVVAGGRLWLRTRAGLGIEGLAVSTAELSPRATFVAAGIGDALVAMNPGGEAAWSHAAGGPVEAIAWAPNPIVIAYVVRRGPDRHALHLIEGDGDNDVVVDDDVSPVRPSWRADTGALAYVRRDGTVRIVTQPLGGPATDLSPAGGRVRQVAFAPSGDDLVLAGEDWIAIAAGGRPGPSLSQDGVDGAAWSGGAVLVAAGRGARGALSSYAAATVGKPFGVSEGPRIGSLAPIGDGARLVAAVDAGSAARSELWEVAAPARGAPAPLTPRRVLLSLPAAAGPVTALSVR
ncbi:MAG: hypothetical protein AB7V42_15870 [Thermoleophilia bacterium]